MIDEYFACSEMRCQFLDSATLEDCSKRACPFAHQRRRERDRKKQQEADETRVPCKVDHGNE